MSSSGEWRGVIVCHSVICKLSHLLLLLLLFWPAVTIVPLLWWGGGLLQVMLLGDSSVGKTCVLVRFKDGAFLGGNFIATVGIDFRVRETLLNRMAHYNVYHVCLFMVCSLVTIMGEMFSKR